MGLFDHLFKPRPDGSVERVVEAPLRASRLIEMKEEGAEEPPPPDPATAFLQPKGYAAGTSGAVLGGQNQGFVPVLPTAKRPHPTERKHTVADGATVAAEMVVLTVGDVLPRIPVAFLRAGPRDLKRELRFHIDDLAPDITRGRPEIALSCIAAQCPDLFQVQIGDAEDMAIRLPLQKLVEQIGRIRSRAPAAVHPPARVPVAPPVEKPKAEASIPAPAPPAAGKAAAPAPLPQPDAPPPQPVPPPIAVAPAVPEPPAPAPAEPETVFVPAESAREPDGEAAAENEPEIGAIEAEEPPPTPAPVRSTEIAPPGSVIDLGLAAIFARIPPDLIAEPLPYIDESYRVALPFPTIERQLGTGSVEVPAKLLWLALPPMLKHYFIAPDDRMVALPLEEIFQNLPFGGSGEKPRVEPVAPPFRQVFGAEAPIVLAPAIFRDETIEFDLGLPSQGMVDLPAKPGDKEPASPPAEAEALPASPLPDATPASVDAKVQEPAAATENPPSPPEAKASLAEPAPSAPVAVPPGAEVPDAPASVTPPDATQAAETVTEPPPQAEPVPESAATAEPSVVSLPKETTKTVPPAPDPATSAPPSEDLPPIVHLQPFRAFSPPMPTVEPEAASEPAKLEPVILGEAPAQPTATNAPVILRFTPEADSVPKEVAPAVPAPAPAAVKEKENTAATPAQPAQGMPEAPAPKFSVLPSPPPQPEPEQPAAPVIPEPEAVVSFNPDQPPPLKVEAPVAAVAVLRATVPAAPEVPAVAMATNTVQPPRIFRPMVMPPPVSGTAPAAPLNVAPTLAGPVSSAGMISLSTAQDSRGSQIAAAPSVSLPPPVVPPEQPKPIASQPGNLPQPEPPPAVTAAPAGLPPESHEEPKLKNLVRRLFAPPADSAPVPSAPAGEGNPAEKSTVAPAASAPVPAASTGAPPSLKAPSTEVVQPPQATGGLHLHLPPLPQAASVAPPPADHAAPPSLPISRFDQHSVQSIFMTEETLDLPKISRLAAALPGIQSCVIVARGETYSSGALPDGFHLNALRGLAPQVGAAADRLPIGELKNFTLYGDQYSVSLFERPAVCLCAIHRARSFVPGVREKLVAVVDELARG
jgi:hypothetical protein